VEIEEVISTPLTRDSVQRQDRSGIDEILEAVVALTRRPVTWLPALRAP
jgi:hypothetical protein